MDLISLLDRFNSDYACRDYLETLRWTNGVACPDAGIWMSPGSRNGASGTVKGVNTTSP